ncbi:MAG: efflux RND transporter periplasmic adaptor subunit [Saprospiraceae bacterium]|nr:efflux RND transporter periplasmic adaptor subunit [Saprospiraceae bacterium]
MNNYWMLIILPLLISCQPQSNDGLPEDLGSLKNLLRQKKSEEKALGDEIKTIESMIAQLDTNLQEKKSLVTTLPMESTDFQRYITIQGSLASRDIVNASSEVGGRILQVLVQEGSSVNRGQLIARVDLESIDKQVAEVEKSLELANDIYERQSRLWEQEIGSEVQYLQAKNNKERLEKSLETLQYQRSRSTVYSPITGTVDKVMLKAGELAAPGAPIAQILDTRNLKVVADAPEDLLTKIKVGDLVEVYFPSIDQREEVRISLIGSSIDPSNRTFQIEMQMQNGSGVLKPNLLAEIKVNDFTEEDVLVLPLSLVQQEVGGRDYVFVAANDDNGLYAKKVYVETGESYDGDVVIKSGLTTEDLVIDQGARGLSANERIEITQDKITSAQ